MFGFNSGPKYCVVTVKNDNGRGQFHRCTVRGKKPNGGTWTKEQEYPTSMTQTEALNHFKKLVRGE